MSKSFNVSFQMSFKVTLTEEQLQEIRKALSDSVAAVDARPERFTATQKARNEVVKEWLQKPDDEFYSFFLKTACRDGLREEVVRILTKDQAMGASKFAPANVSVTPRG